LVLNVGIFVATGKTTGIGHLKRCISIGKELRNLSHDVKFNIDNDSYVTLISKYGFAYVIDSTWSLGGYDIIIVDTYDITTQMLSKLKNNCKILVRIDDGYPLIEYDFCSDVIINGNPYGNSDYYHGRVKHGCKILAGKYYVPMDPGFCLLREKYRVRDEMRNLVITFGASNDPFYPSAAVRSISTLTSFDNIIVLNGEILEGDLDLSSRSGIRFLPLLDDIFDILFHADLVVCSASTICWQLATIGIPFITFQTVENQRNGFRYIGESDIGIALSEAALFNGELNRQILRLDKVNRIRAYDRSRNAIACNGSIRIAHDLSSIISP
jgi:spore coat polysaccharide biosynthesis predicted glycosyltransferase SpsG